MSGKTSRCFFCQLPAPLDDARAKTLEEWARQHCSHYALSLDTGGGTAELRVMWPEERSAKSHKLMLRNLAQRHPVLQFGQLKDFQLVSEEVFKKMRRGSEAGEGARPSEPSTEPHQPCAPNTGSSGRPAMADRAEVERANDAAAEEVVASLPGGFDIEAKARYDKLLTGRAVAVH